MGIDTYFIHRCIQTLEFSMNELQKIEHSESLSYDAFQASCVKEFELTLALSGKLLRNALEHSMHITAKPIVYRLKTCFDLQPNTVC